MRFSLMRMANVSRHQSTEEFLATFGVLCESLDPGGVLAIKNAGDGCTDEVFYRKVEMGDAWGLAPLDL